MKLKKLAALLAISGFTAPAFATNGMNMEGYGPVGTAMGGASFAYDNGTAGLINNPATLALMQSGTSRLDIAVGGLHPDVTTKQSGMSDAHSGGDAYYMPAVGYVRKDGKFAYGIGMMAQGGMGTEYGKTSSMSHYESMATMMGGGSQGMSGLENRSELGIGRVMFPLTYDVSDSFKVGGTLDYLWGGLDLQMMMDGTTFARMTNFGGAPSTRIGYASGSMIQAFTGFQAMGLTDLNYAQFDFSEGVNKMKQRLTTNGWAGNIGFVWQATPQLSIGGVYHAKTDLQDMEGNGKMNMQVVMGGATMPMSISGKLRVIDFQWPETFGFGMAYQANDKLLLVADYKRIGWSDSMKNFKMSFTASGNAGMLAGLNGTSMNAVLRQNWDDQDVLMLGGSYKFTDALTLRAGLNLANNPVPDKYMNPLFPAIIKNTVTFGFGYQFNKVSSVDFSLTHAPSVTAKNDNDGMGAVSTEHAQKNNWQLMYSHRF
jgi:long-chain fatty acid transport protein